MSCWISIALYQEQPRRQAFYTHGLSRTHALQVLSLKWGMHVGQHVSTVTIRRRLQQHGLSARRPWLRLPLKLHQRQERLQSHVKPTLQLDNTLLHVAGIVRTSLDTKMFGCCPSLHIHQMCRQYKRYGPWLLKDSVTTVDELWHCIEAAWTYVPVPAI
ncbi:hypothetical protein TNCV_2308941 [Trichonephila clavipes]|nr:hypothetical protein TNCV_2308941 [Trichonephila clavipes]